MIFNPIFFIPFLKKREPEPEPEPEPEFVMDSCGHITTTDAIKKREQEADAFWDKLHFAEELLGRKLTKKESWRAMQKGMWCCVCCGDVLRKVDKETVKCSTCGLKFKWVDGDIKTVSMNGELI